MDCTKVLTKMHSGDLIIKMRFHLTSLCDHTLSPTTNSPQSATSLFKQGYL